MFFTTGTIFKQVILSKACTDVFMASTFGHIFLPFRRANKSRRSISIKVLDKRILVRLKSHQLQPESYLLCTDASNLYPNDISCEEIVTRELYFSFIKTENCRFCYRRVNVKAVWNDDVRNSASSRILRLYSFYLKVHRFVLVLVVSYTYFCLLC